MKKYSRVFYIFMALIILISTGCSTAPTTEAANQQPAADAAQPAADSGDANADGGLVYYLAPSLSDEFQAGTNKLMIQYGTEMGYKVKALNAGNKAPLQINQMDDAINQKPKAIILNAVDVSTITSSVEKARAAGIPVIVFDRFIQNTQTDFHSVMGTIKLGQIAAGEIARLLKEKNGSEKGTVLEVMGDSGDSYTVMIDQGFMDEMKKYPDIKVVSKTTPGYEITTTANIVDDQLTANQNKLDIIFIHSDSRIPAIIPVLQAHNLNKGDVIVVGTDGAPTGLQSIRDGWALETVGVPLDEQIYAVWQFMGDVIAKKSFTDGTVKVKSIEAEMKLEEWGPTLYLPGQIVDNNNVEDPANWGNMKVDLVN